MITTNMKTILIIAAYFATMFLIAFNATAGTFPRNHSSKHCKHVSAKRNRQGKKL